MNCPDCGAPMRLDDDKDYFTCEYCRNVHFPEPNEDGVRVLGDPVEQECPVCGVPLVNAAIVGRRFLYCRRCRGMLIRVDTFVAIVEDLRARREAPAELGRQPDEKDLERHIRCPQCHEDMDTHPYAGPGNVIIDNCPSCELNWLDYGELRRIVRAPDRQYSADEWVTT
jgi:Zn-finger nucleic acid-binding protein